MTSNLTRMFLGIMFTTLIASGVIMFFSGGVEEYAPTSYDNSSLVKIKDKFDDIYTITNQTKTEIDNIDSQEGIGDLVGLFLGKGITAVKLTTGMFDVINDIIDIAVTELFGTGEFAQVVKTMIPAMILTIIVISILLHALLKSDRL